VKDSGNRTRSEIAHARRDPSNRSRAWLFHVFSCDAPMAPLAAACDLADVDEVVLGRGELGTAPSSATEKPPMVRSMRTCRVDIH
jgi:hypothetical protein